MGRPSGQLKDFGARFALAAIIIGSGSAAVAQQAPASAAAAKVATPMPAPNPFVPPSQRIDRKVLESVVRETVRDEVKDIRRGAPGMGSVLQPNGMPTPPGMAGAMGSLPSQPGMPGGVSTAGGLSGGSVVAGGPVDELLKDGGRFIGCADGTPIFTDKQGRRVYFTTVELQSSVAPKRMARCRA